MTGHKFDLEGRGLVVQRGGRLVLDGVSFVARSGTPLVITGPNGAGKSTLLRVVAGFLPVVGGQLVFHGQPCHGDQAPAPNQFHYIGHMDGIKPVMSVRDHLTFWARYMGGDQDGVERALAGFDLIDLAELPGSVLSAGQKRRLALARLLLCKRSLWLLDEPTVSLDAAARDKLQHVLTTHCAQGGVALIASHDPLEIPDARELTLTPIQKGRAA